METVNTVTNEEFPAKRKKRYSSGLRLWHWLTAAAITALLITVLINSSILKRKNTVPLIKSALTEKNVTISDDQARAVSHELTDSVWKIHTYIGFGLAALFLFRLVVEIFQRKEQRLTYKLRKAYRQYIVTREIRVSSSRHEFWVKTLYAVFYIILLLTVITGLDLAFEDDYPFLRSLHFLREIHQFNMYLILTFIVLHIDGIFLAERREGEKGIVSDMINGGNDI